VQFNYILAISVNSRVPIKVWGELEAVMDKLRGMPDELGDDIAKVTA
jgi:hypothetical protein